MTSKNTLILILAGLLAAVILFTCNCRKLPKPVVITVKEQVKAVEKKEAILQPVIDSLYKELVARDIDNSGLQKKLVAAQSTNKRLANIITKPDTVWLDPNSDEYAKHQAALDLVANNIISDSLCKQEINGLNQQLITTGKIINLKDSLYSDLRIAFNTSMEQQNILTAYSNKLQKKVHANQRGKFIWKAAAIIGSLFILKTAIK